MKDYNVSMSYKEKPEENFYLLRNMLIDVIKRIIDEHGWSQTKASEKMNIHRSHLCKILNGTLNQISELKLLRCIISAGYNINIVIDDSSGIDANINVKYKDNLIDQNLLITRE